MSICEVGGRSDTIFVLRFSVLAVRVDGRRIVCYSQSSFGKEIGERPCNHNIRKMSESHVENPSSIRRAPSLVIFKVFTMAEDLATKERRARKYDGSSG